MMVRYRSEWDPALNCYVGIEIRPGCPNECVGPVRPGWIGCALGGHRMWVCWTCKHEIHDPDCGCHR